MTPQKTAQEDAGRAPQACQQGAIPIHAVKTPSKQQGPPVTKSECPACRKIREQKTKSTLSGLVPKAETVGKWVAALRDYRQNTQLRRERAMRAATALADVLSPATVAEELQAAHDDAVRDQQTRRNDRAVAAQG